MVPAPSAAKIIKADLIIAIWRGEFVRGFPVKNYCLAVSLSLFFSVSYSLSLCTDSFFLFQKEKEKDKETNRKRERADGNQSTAIPADPTSGMPVLKDFSLY